MAYDPNASVSTNALAISLAFDMLSAAQDVEEAEIVALTAKVAALEAAAGSPPVQIYLTLTGALSYATDASAGTAIGAIGNVPAGATPTLTPNDGRLVIAGNASTGWKLAVGMSASSAGSFDVTIAAAGATSVTKTVTVTAVAAPAPSPTPPPSGNLPALNSRFFDAMNNPAADYYTASTIEADYGKSCGISYREGDNYGQIFPPHSGVNGLATWKMPPGITLPSADPSIQIISTNGATGIHRVNILRDGPTNTDTRIVNFNGPKPDYITVTRDGVDGEFAPEALNAKFGAFMRNLDMGTQNGTDPNATTRQDDEDLTDASPFNIAYRANGDGYAAIPFERQVRFVAAKRAVDPEFLGLFDVIAVDRTEAQIRARARYMRDYGGGAYWMFQAFNESPWNIRFQAVYRAMMEAFRHGFYGTGTHANPAPLLNPVCRPGYINPGDAASPATKAGDYVLFNIGGRGSQFLRAKKDVPAGAPVDNNEYWETIYGHNECQDFGKYYEAHFLNRVCDIAREEYGDERYEREVVPVMMGQNGGSNHNGSVLGQFGPQRAFVPELWAKVKGFGYATYLDPGGVDGFDEDNSTVESLAYWLRYKSFAHLQQQLTVLQAEADSEGKFVVLYEGGPAMSENVGYPSKGHYRSVQLDYFTSEECALQSADYSSWLKQNIRGVGTYFMSVTADNVAGSGLGIFGQRRSFNDVTSKRYVGYQRGLTTDYTPRSTVPPATAPAPAPSPTPSPTPTPAPAPTPTPAPTGFARNGSTNTALKTMMAGVKAGTRRGMIVYKGDSVTTGIGSSIVSGIADDAAQNTDARKGRPPAVLARLASAAGYAALDGGMVGRNGSSQPLPVYDPRVSFPGASWAYWAAADRQNFPAGGFLDGNNAGPLIFTPTMQCDTFEMVMLNVGGRVTILIDGAAPTSITAPGATVNGNVVDVVNSDSGESRITVKAASAGMRSVSVQASGVTFMRSIRGWNSGVAAIDCLVHAAGSATSAEQSFSGNGWSNNDALAFDAPDLTIIKLGLNDSARGVSAADYKANVGKIIDTAKATGDVLVLWPHAANPDTFAPDAIQDALRIAASEIAAAKGVAFGDHRMAFGSWATIASRTADNTVHPNKGFYEDIAAYDWACVQAMIA
jgi:hypothetical protein